MAQKEIHEQIDDLETKQQKDVAELKSIIDFNAHYPHLLSEKQLQQRENLCFQIFTREEEMRNLRAEKQAADNAQGQTTQSDWEPMVDDILKKVEEISKDPNVQKWWEVLKSSLSSQTKPGEGQNGK